MDKRATKGRSFPLQSIRVCYIIVRTIKSGEYVMIKEASKILQLIIEFCRDNLDIPKTFVFSSSFRKDF